MCIVSMIHDHYNDWYHKHWPWNVPKIIPPVIRPAPQPRPTPLTDDEIQELLDKGKEYRDAIKKAKQLDELTSQPDCEDPEKAALEKRVEALEEELRKIKLSRAKSAKRSKKLRHTPDADRKMGSALDR